MVLAKFSIAIGAIAAILFVCPTTTFAQRVISARPVMHGAPAGVIAQPTPASHGQWSQRCSRCGGFHGPSVSTAYPTRTASTRLPGAAPSSGVSNVLGALNAQRARQGLSSLRPDAQLQAVAQRRASLMASMGIKSHPPGSFAPGRYEGVGWSSSHSPSGVSACFTSNPNMRVAGAAMARGRDGVYFCVVYR